MALQRKLVLFLIPVLIALTCYSCATAPPQAEKVPELYWPLPPEKPRIKFVDIILGNLDVSTKASMLRNFVFGAQEDGRFIKPYGVTARNNVMYVTDITAVHVFDFGNGRFSVIGRNELKSPAGIAVTSDRAYVADVATKKIYVYDLQGQFKMDFGAKDIAVPAGLALDEKRGRLIISDSKKHCVHVYDLNGIKLFSFGQRGAALGEFNIPYGVAVDKEGRIYVVDGMNFRLQVFNEKGVFLKSFGEIGTSPGSFARPKAVALDSDGHVYVLDSSFSNFQIFDYDGNTLLSVGTNGSDPGEFLLPSSIAIDEHDKIYVVDQINKRVQIFQYLRDQQQDR